MPGESDATMDPWCLVELPGGAAVLFGFARSHPSTGGQSWIRSTPVMELDEGARRAVTASGRRYRLGTRVEVGGLPDGEARIALAMLVGPVEGARVPDDPASAAQWLTACKVARHLGVEPPTMRQGAASEFLRSHGELYAFLRSGGRPS